MPSPIFPATLVRFPAQAERRSAAFYLAAEEYVARELPEGNYAFFWQLGPTCVFGRHQDPRAELDVGFCQAHGVELVRRKSGGGTIFADENNIMVSLVTGSGSVEDIFEGFARSVANGLRTLGVPTRVSGRNDICLDDGRKICGGAFYHLPQRNIVHCTMLYDTQMELMRGCLTPARAKLESKGVKSVESRIGLLKDFLPFGVAQLREELAKILCTDEVCLTPQQVARIEEIERPYHDEAYIFGSKNYVTDKHSAQRIEGCGRIEFRLSLHEGKIQHVDVAGDYFETSCQPASEAFSQALCGLPLTADAITTAIRTRQPHRTIRGLSEEKAIALLTVNIQHSTIKL